MTWYMHTKEIEMEHAIRTRLPHRRGMEVDIIDKAIQLEQPRRRMRWGLWLQRLLYRRHARPPETVVTRLQPTD